ncbi:ABC transporter permease [Nocardia sp. NBC_01329]|uniref:ABC transporter permease n=1 Tax=Nocardia sp. NBC_01329 TaxID=2903594 RepID=UPI002E159693|nr:ABC-2 family transporter protein [Nocardia sp. NBC_01329]
MPATVLDLRGTAGVYRRLLVAGFRRQWHYKLAMFAGLFTNCVFGFVRASVMVAAIGATGGFAGYDAGSIGAYVWISQGLLGAMQFMAAEIELAERVRTGDIAIDFLRPVDVQLGNLAADLGRALCTLIPRGIPSLLIGSLTFGLVLPTAPGPYLLGALSILLAAAISYLSLFALTMIGFWVVETRGFRSLYQTAGTFLAGLFVPVHIFPDWLRAIAESTPFPSMLQVPVDVLSGRATGWDAAALVGTQIFWLLVVGALGRVMLAAGRRKLEVQGG